MFPKHHVATLNKKHILPQSKYYLVLGQVNFNQQISYKSHTSKIIRTRFFFYLKDKSYICPICTNNNFSITDKRIKNDIYIKDINSLSLILQASIELHSSNLCNKMRKARTLAWGSQNSSIKRMYSMEFPLWRK